MVQDILIVEDEPFFAGMCAKSLRQSGRTVRIASNGEEAISLMQEKEPDLVLLDLLMPKVDGFSVIEFLKGFAHRFPVIILSNLGDDADPDLSDRYGAAAYCVKSDTTLEKLCELVDEFLGSEAAWEQPMGLQPA